MLNFFQEVTPIEEISKLQISSRPARRKKGAKDLSSLELFHGYLVGHKVDFFCQAGLELAALSSELNSDPQQIELLRVLHQRWPFFRMLISKAEMTLSKVDLRVLNIMLTLLAVKKMKLFR